MKQEKLTSVNSIEKAVKIRNRVRIPLTIDGKTYKQVYFITFSGLSDTREHLAICFNHLAANDVPIVRIHSECLTGDVFHSLRCDCGLQLEESMQCFARTNGIILYLRQEGRDIGLYNKLDAYRLQEAGYDTFEANQLLSFSEDARDFKMAAEMLFAIGYQNIRLLSNNQEKQLQLEQYGIQVIERIATQTYLNQHNYNYLKSKKCKHKHILDVDDGSTSMKPER